MEKQYDVFISYRRLDENGNISGRDQARLIAKQLELEGYHPFFDYSEIKDNEFDKVIIPAIEKCKVFILVLTKDSLNRCKNDEDWVRREIETAITTGCKIINVTPDNAFNGWPTNLPSSLSKIKNIQISEIHMGSLFELSVKKMINDRIADGLKLEKLIEQDICKYSIEESEFIDSFDDFEESQTSEDFYQTGLNLFHGRGVEKDQSTAIRYYIRAAELNHPKAQRLLYACYLQGIGVNQDSEVALYWLQRAAENKNLFALYKCYELSFASNDFDKAKSLLDEIVKHYRYLVSNNLLSDKEIERKKDEEYYIKAVIGIGELYENGRGIPKDYERAKEWYREALKYGRKEPMVSLLDRIKAEADEELIVGIPELLSIEEKYELAIRYLEGKGLEESFEKALPLLLDCSKNGTNEANKILGMCYLKGGYESWIKHARCEVDYNLGYYYLTKYLETEDDPDVMFEVGLLYEYGLGVEIDYTKALNFYKKSIANGGSSALNHIGLLYKYGKLGNRNSYKYSVCKALADRCSFAMFKNNIERFGLNYSFEEPSIHILFEDCDIAHYYLSILNEIDSQNKINMTNHPSYQEIEEALTHNLVYVQKRLNENVKSLILEIKPADFKDSFDLDYFSKNVKAVDLDLPSGALWCNQNVYSINDDTSQSMFAWAESVPKETFSWNNYFDKRDNSTGKFEHINIHNALFGTESIDAAKMNFGETWSIPTRSLFEELLKECSWEWCNIDGKNGYKVIGKNDNWIFLPILDAQKNIGGYWTFTLNQKDAKYADFLWFDSSRKGIKACQRCLGMNIRPVAIINKYGNPLNGHSFTDSFLEI